MGYNMLRSFVLVAALASVALPTYAADLPVKAAPANPFVLGYAGNGFYKGVGTFGEMNDAKVAGGSVNAFGGALQGCGGYQWANTGGGTFSALHACGAYHNVGGSNVDGAITSRWSATAEFRFGGPITNVLQWLPANVALPALPAVGTAVGSAHPYVGLGGKLQDAHAVVDEVVKRKIDAKGYLATGLLQQYCTTPTSCVTLDTFFHFSPSQDGVKIFGEQQKLGKQYVGGVSVLW